MAYSKTIILVVFVVLLITAEVSAHRDLIENTTATIDGRGGYNQGGNGGNGEGNGGYGRGSNGGNIGGRGGYGGGNNRGNRGGKGGYGGRNNRGNGGGRGGYEGGSNREDGAGSIGVNKGFGGYGGGSNGGNGGYGGYGGGRNGGNGGGSGGDGHYANYVFKCCSEVGGDIFFCECHLNIVINPCVINPNSLRKKVLQIAPLRQQKASAPLTEFA